MQTRSRSRAAARETTLTDLPTDVLAHILSFVPQADRFRAATLCRDLAAAARPPSAVWTDISVTSANVRCAGGRHKSFRASFPRAVTSVRRLEVEAEDAKHIARLARVATAAMPYLESLSLSGGECDIHLPGLVAGVRPAWASATQLTRFALGEYAQVYAPGGLSATAWDAAATSFVTGGHRLHHELTGIQNVVPIAEAAAPVARLARLRGWVATDPPAFAAFARQSLTRLDADVFEHSMPRLCDVVNSLDSLKELGVLLDFDGDDDTTRMVDLSAAINSARSLTRLKVRGVNVEAVRLSDVLAGRLRDLDISDQLSQNPPRFIQGDRFSRLTRLKYERFGSGLPANLGVWTDVGLIHLPTLVELRVQSYYFTLDCREGERWAVVMAETSLPRLRLLTLGCPYTTFPAGHVQFICRAAYNTYYETPPGECPCCGAAAECEESRAARHAVFNLLPAAYARRGHVLRVTELPAGVKRPRVGQHVEAHFEAVPRR